MRTLPYQLLSAAALAALLGCGRAHSGDANAQPVVPEGVPETPPVEPEPQFQTAFATALQYPQDEPAVTTFRMPITLVRPGTRVQIAVWGHDGAMSVQAAHIGLWQGGGAVVDDQPFTFDGAPGVQVGFNQVVASDPLAYPISPGRYAITLVLQGAVAAGLAIQNDGVAAPGNLAAQPTITGTWEPAIRGLKWVAVESAPQRVVAVLGDSIGAGDSARGLGERFVDVAQLALGFPVVDASWGGDGILHATQRIAPDVAGIPGVTDCVVQVGTNDLHREDPQFLIDNLSLAYNTLRAAGIRPWGATILPKAPGVLTAGGELTRQQVNAFIRSTPLVEGVVDWAPDLATPGDPSMPAPGMLRSDGIHPDTPGHKAMADALVRTFGAASP